MQSSLDSVSSPPILQTRLDLSPRLSSCIRLTWILESINLILVILLFIVHSIVTTTVTSPGLTVMLLAILLPIAIQSSTVGALFRLRNTDTVVAKIVDGVPPAEERITENGQGSSRRREIHPLEGRDAAALNLQNVVVGRHIKLVA